MLSFFISGATSPKSGLRLLKSGKALTFGADKPLKNYMLSVAIIDDEPAARQLIRTILEEKMPDVHIAGEVSGVEEATILLQKLKPDLVLLDIALKDGTGFDLLNRWTGPPFQVIFITAFDTFAVKAFRYSALDFLVKPFDPADLVSAIGKAAQPMSAQQVSAWLPKQLANLLATKERKAFEKIALPSAEALHLVIVKDIVHLESDAGYTTVFITGGERIVVSRTIKDFEELLPENSFFRIHQSHIINLKFARKVLREDGGYVLLSDGAKLPISRRRKEEFMEALLREGSIRSL